MYCKRIHVAVTIVNWYSKYVLNCTSLQPKQLNIVHCSFISIIIIERLSIIGRVLCTVVPI